MQAGCASNGLGEMMLSIETTEIYRERLCIALEVVDKFLSGRLSIRDRRDLERVRVLIIEKAAQEYGVTLK